ncbi:MAG TPA: sigma-54 dependent transcriptional regulator [Candidatus Dormibacteraeota bacterium]|nr:sigma-54 dependent transcriptional regulator [Candidatus Dormibacteraeota bacterium]
MDQPRVLIVDDEHGVRESLRLILKDRAALTLADSGEAALLALEQQPFDVVLLDILMPGLDGLEILERVRARSAGPQVIMLTATKTVKTAVRAMRLGAFDYVTKPFDVDELLIIVERAVQSSALMQEVSALRSEVGQRHSFDNVIGRSAGMQSVLDTVARVAPLKTTVLLTGESGTGKEVIAKAVHYNSPRANAPLVAINCAAIPENLLESELFGHERGAFTDAHARKLGHFESAHKGTIFLDEIGEMNPATQAKLLRVLETGTFTRVGGSQPVTVDVRVVAATNRDLDKSMQDGSFRPDLYFRLNVVAIHLPPLRDRREDLPLLIRHFLQRKSTELGLPAKRFSREATDILLRYRWPGNVRELENIVERALALSLGNELTLDDLPPHLTASAADPEPVRAAATAATSNGGASLADAVDRLEHLLISDALTKAEHNQTRAAEILGTTRRILKYKMDKLGIADKDMSELS